MADTPEVACFLIEPRVGGKELRERLRKAYPGIVFQLADPKVGSNERYFKMIAAQTISAMKNRSLLAKKPEFDLLLRLARTTQITEALQVAGYKEGAAQILIAAGGQRDLKKFLASGRTIGPRLSFRELSEEERMKIEEAAVLSAIRG